jgi:arylsulfatase A
MIFLPFIRFILLALVCSIFVGSAQAKRKPNIVFIMADDLGYGEIGSFGQKVILTPHLDRMAQEGMRLTNFYANSICAPSRASLLTGKSSGHSIIRDNYEFGTFLDSEEFGQMPLPPDTYTIGRMLQSAGYTTAVMGKWGVGGPQSAGVPWKQGFDFFYGYLDQKQAHNYYPTHLWRNSEWEKLPNPYFSPHQKLGDKDPQDLASYSSYKGKAYSGEAITAEAENFIRANRQKPFFLYLAYTIPHMALQVPDEELAAYAGKFDEEPYTGGRGYLPHIAPRSAYAAMITLLDKYVGRISKTLKEQGLDENTLVIFTSDNGPSGGADTKFFNSAGSLRGMKGGLYEGGIRVPFIARWPRKIKPGTTSAHASALWDMMPTFGEVAGLKAVPYTNGLSLLPTLLGQDNKQVSHEYLYWEIHRPMNGMQAVRFGNWKACRKGLHDNPNAPIELYNLENDLAESKDLAALYPDLVKKAEGFMNRRESAIIADWNFIKPAKIN